MKLGLFFTKGMSLQVWVETGLIDREIAIYENHLQQGFLEKVYWFTYGVNDDIIYKDLLQSGRLDSRIIVISPSKLFARRVWRHCYWWMLPFIHGKEYRELDMTKSNQRSGATAAWLVAKMYGIPFYFRTGYTESVFVLHEEGKSRRYYWTRNSEKFLYQKCSISAVSSKHDREHICLEYGVSRNKVKLVRNFIDTNLFHKSIEIQGRCNELLFIGRLNPQKNLQNTIRSIKKCDRGMDIYGVGELQEELKLLAESIGANVSFKGVVANSEIPDILNKYKYYILASTHEGMPKTLLEAMACGCICIGTPVEGISEVIEDGVNGFLAKGTETKDIVDAIKRACSNENKEKISECARALIESKYSLRKIADIDRENMKKILKN